MRRYLKQLILFLLFLAVIATLHWSGLGSYLSLDNLKEHRDMLARTVAAHYALSVMLYILLYIVITTFALPGALILTLAGGLLFRTFPGVIYVCTGATIGAVLAFLFSRHILGNWLQHRYAAQFQRFNRELAVNGHLYLLSVRLIPVFPFFLINFLSGLTRIPLRTFAWTTALGILPGSFIYTFAGNQLGTVASVKDLVSPRILVAFLLLALLTISPIIWKKVRATR